MKRLAWLLLLPFASGALFAQGAYTMAGNVPASGTVGVSYSASLTTSPQAYAVWSYTGSLPPGLSMTTGSSYAAAISGTPTVAGTYTFTVQANLGTNPNAAPIIVTKAYTVTIAPTLTVVSGSLPGGVVNGSYSQNLSAVGGYGIGTYTFTLVAGSSLPPGLQLYSGGVVYGTPTTAGSYSFTVQVTSQSGTSPVLTTSGTFSLSISPPPLTITASSLPAGTVGVLYSQTLAATGGSPPYTWQVSSSSLPGGLTIASSGNISGTPTTAGSFTFQVTVRDSAQGSASSSFTIRITAAALAVTTASLPAGTVGTAYTATTLAATGGTPPYTWSVASGALPGGLSISSAGVISGTPTASGTFSVTLQVTDSAQAAATKAYSVTVAAAAAPLSITTQAPLAGAVVGMAYTQTFTATGGTSPYQWSILAGAGFLPTGLTLSAAGSLSGTPVPTPGTFPFTVQVADSAGRTATKAFTLTIAEVLIIGTANPLPGATVGAPYNRDFVLDLVGGIAPFTWSIASGALPAGITLSSAGSLSGTPTTAGTFTFTVSVTGGGQTATKLFTITVTAALTITTDPTLPNGTVGTAYSQTLALAGGSGTFTWSVSAGTLPGGITLNSAGSLSGTPSAPGTFTFTVSVTGGGQSTTKSLTITVGVPPAPPATITGLPATVAPATQPALGIAIPNTYPLDITGQVTLTFAPDPPSPDGQEVVFTTGGRTVSFTVPANTTQAVFSGATPGVQTGTVSGTITLTLKLTAAGIDITSAPTPTTTLLIPKSAPKITSATVTRTSGGFNIVVVGYATSREMVSATIGFTAAAGVTLSSSQAAVPLAAVFTTWYQSSASAAYGSQFSLNMPFTFSSSTAPLTSVSVQLTSGQGNSNSMSATY